MKDTSIVALIRAAADVPGGADALDAMLERLDAALDLFAMANPGELPRAEADAWWAQLRGAVEKRAARMAAANDSDER